MKDSPNVRRRQQTSELRDRCDSNEENLIRGMVKTPRSRKWVFSLLSVKAAIVLLLFPFCLLLILLGRTVGFRFFPRQLRGHRPPLNDIPKPDTNRKISVVIMNHDRPQILQHSTLLPTLTQHDNILEILLLHSNPKSAFHSNITLANRIHDISNMKKLKDIDAVPMNNKLGLALRFHFCATSAHNDWVLIMDDDIEVDSTAIDALLFHMQKDPKRIVGHFGRSLVQPNIISRLMFDQPDLYDTKTIYGTVEVVLTKMLLLERDVCVQFLKQMYIMDDLATTSKPLWNGEDLFVSLVANRYYGVPWHGPYRNLAVAELPVWEADVPETSEGAAESISGNLDDHRIWRVRCSSATITWNTKSLWQVGISQWKAAYTKAREHNLYRGRFWRTAKERLYRLDLSKRK
jgi:Glycosyl transferase family 64 domain